MPIVTESLLLRRPEAGDAAWITREIANPRFHRWLTNPPKPFARIDAEAWLARVSGDPMVRVIEAGGAPQGVVSISTRGGERNLGYWLAERAWGQGSMTEAAGALARYFFTREAGPLHSGWLIGNGASERVLRKLGFRDDGESTEFSRFHGCRMRNIRVVLDAADGLHAPPSRAKRG
ncbi:MAG: GNAT family N-acetyltransferase [Pseudomonadota bacterium]